MKTKLYILLLLVFGLSASLKAQKPATDSPLTKQFTENKIPGAKYAPVTQPNAAKSKGFEGSSLAKQIRDGKEEGMKYNSSAAETPKNPTGITTEKPGALGSNLSVGEGDKKIKQAEVTPAKASNQEQKKE